MKMYRIGLIALIVLSLGSMGCSRSSDDDSSSDSVTSSSVAQSAGEVILQVVNEVELTEEIDAKFGMVIIVKNTGSDTAHDLRLIMNFYKNQSVEPFAEQDVTINATTLDSNQQTAVEIIIEPGTGITDHDDYESYGYKFSWNQENVDTILKTRSN